MEPLSRIADQDGEASLDIEVNILQFQPPHKLAAVDFFADLAQAKFDSCQVIRTDDAGSCEHSCVSKRSANIVVRQSPVEAYRCGISLHQFRDRLVKSSRPCVCAFFSG